MEFMINVYVKNISDKILIKLCFKVYKFIIIRYMYIHLDTCIGVYIYIICMIFYITIQGNSSPRGQGPPPPPP